MTASEPRNNKWLKNSLSFYNAISRQSISTLSCKGLANIRGENVFHNKKNQSMLAIPQKTSFDRELRSRVVYRLTFSGCNSTYVGQTVQHLATRADEHRKKDSTVGQHLLECKNDVGVTAELKSDIIDKTANTQKLLKLEALHIWRERPRINTRDEFRSRELTLKL